MRTQHKDEEETGKEMMVKEEGVGEKREIKCEIRNVTEKERKKREKKKTIKKG